MTEIHTALSLAYESNSIIRYVETDEGNRVAGIVLSEKESSSPQIHRFVGEDAAGVRIEFEVVNTDEKVSAITLKRGRERVPYGEVEDIVVD